MVTPGYRARDRWRRFSSGKDDVKPLGRDPGCLEPAVREGTEGDPAPVRDRAPAHGTVTPACANRRDD